MRPGYREPDSAPNPLVSNQTAQYPGRLSARGGLDPQPRSGRRAQRIPQDRQRRLRPRASIDLDDDIACLEAGLGCRSSGDDVDDLVAVRGALDPETSAIGNVRRAIADITIEVDAVARKIEGHGELPQHAEADITRNVRSREGPAALTGDRNHRQRDIHRTKLQH